MNELNLKLRRRENQSTQRKTLQSGGENQQQQELNPNHIAGRQGQYSYLLILLLLLTATTTTNNDDDDDNDNDNNIKHGVLVAGCRQSQYSLSPREKKKHLN